jgi:hypothetical protein
VEWLEVYTLHIGNGRMLGSALGASTLAGGPVYSQGPYDKTRPAEALHFGYPRKPGSRLHQDSQALFLIL